MRMIQDMIKTMLVFLAAVDLPTSWCASRGAFLVAQSYRSSQRPRGGGRGVCRYHKCCCCFCIFGVFVIFKANWPLNSQTLHLSSIWSISPKQLLSFDLWTHEYSEVGYSIVGGHPEGSQPCHWWLPRGTTYRDSLDEKDEEWIIIDDVQDDKLKRNLTPLTPRWSCTCWTTATARSTSTSPPSSTSSPRAPPPWSPPVTATPPLHRPTPWSPCLLPPSPSLERSSTWPSPMPSVQTLSPWDSLAKGSMWAMSWRSSTWRRRTRWAPPSSIPFPSSLLPGVQGSDCRGVLLCGSLWRSLAESRSLSNCRLWRSCTSCCQVVQNHFFLWVS